MMIIYRKPAVFGRDR